MTDLKGRLDELAGDVAAFEVSTSAYRAGVRRRRQRMLALPVAVAALGALVVGTVTVVGGRHQSGAPSVPTVQVADTTTVSRADWIPATVHLGAPDDTLPTGHGIGPAALTYGYPARHAWWPGVLAADGTRYALPADHWAGRGGFDASLSPDGRFVVYRTRGHLALRDLTGTRITELPAGGVLGWSSNSEWLVVGSPGAIRGSVLVQTRTGRTTPIRVNGTDRWTLASVTTTGKLWLVPDPARFQLSLVDPVTGSTTRRLTMAVVHELNPDEKVLPDGLLFGPPTHADAELLLPIQVWRSQGHSGRYGVPEDVLAVSLRTGKAIRRYDLPRGVVDLDGGQSWNAVRYTGSDIVAVFSSPTEGTVQLIDARTGVRRTISHIEAEREVYQMRGRYFFGN